MKTLIEIHALQNFAPSNLNRDDTGAPKDALFGGSLKSMVLSLIDDSGLNRKDINELRQAIKSLEANE